MLVGREQEQAVIDRLLAEARASRGGVVVMRGEAGIGKSALLADATSRARGATVVSACGAEAEDEVGFAALADLLRPLDDHIAALPSGQAAVLRGALATGPPGPGDEFAVYTAVLNLLVLAAEEQPLLVTVDDAHWLDPASAAALLFAARRLEGEPIAMILAVRDGLPSMLDSSRLPELALGGLSTAAAGQLLAREVGLGVAPGVIATLVQSTGSNPLALVEAARRLDAEQLAGRRALDEPVRVGDLETAFLRQVSELPEGAQQALLVAAAGGSAPAAAVAEASERLGLRRHELATAETAGLVSVIGGKVAFRHPLVRSAVYHAASPVQRRAAHAAMAKALDAEEPRKAWHLARAATGPDEMAASALDGLGEAEQSRGAHATGAAAYAKAAELTPDPTVRARRLLAAAQAWTLGGEVARALAALDEAALLGRDPGLRADIALGRARVTLWQDPGEAIRVLVEHATRIEGTDPGRAAQLLVEETIAHTMRGDVTAAVGVADRALTAGQRASGAVVAMTQANAAAVCAIAGHTVRAACLLADWRRHEGGLADGPHALPFAATAMYCLGRDEESEGLLAALVGQARAAGLLGTLAFPLGQLAQVRFRLGRWPAATADAAEAVRLAEETGHTSEVAHASVVLARIEAAQGQEAACREHAATCLEITGRLGTDSLLTYAAAALGLLELGLGRADEAAAQLERVVELLHEDGVANPAVIQAHPDLVEALVRAGRTEDAAEVLAELDRQAQQTAHPWALAVAARCRGLLADDGAFASAFEEALRLHARRPAPFDRARTALCYGERLRRRRHRAAARRHLHAALVEFERLGAGPWAERARVELDRAGAGVRREPAPSLGELTPQELQVTLAVAEGATNKEAAAALFLSPRTVDFHLRNTYAKLGIRSRTELAALVMRATSPTSG